MKFKTNWPLDYNGKLYPTGKTVDIDDEEQIEILLVSGVISAPAKAVQEEEPTKPTGKKK